MKKTPVIISILVILSMVLSACTNSTPTPVPTSPPTAAPSTAEPTAAPVDDSLYLNLIWHQHQPLYYKDDNGVYTRPWVRVHATKDYFDMAAVVAKYPNVHITFNLTPVLIKQLDDYANGAKDLYWVKAEIPADQLNDEDKRFILERFFDANWDHIIKVYPRYQELLEKRAGTDTAAIDAALQSFTVQDYRDLQIWFNLAWFDPDLLAVEPLNALVQKGRDFSEDDKKIVFDQALEVIKSVVSIHKRLQDIGQIEVITTPYAHPILPLITDSKLALVGNPTGESPTQFSYPQDAAEHLSRSVEIYQDHYGQAPTGLWPGEGSVAQEIVPMVIQAGYQWMATGEPVLAKSLNIEFSRDGKETVRQADELYRPYYVTDGNGNNLAVFFRDWVISDKIGFTYSGMSGQAAAQDFIQRLENIKSRLQEQAASGPHVVTIVVDGENAWENYNNDGKEFFNNLYGMLEESTTIKTITPSKYLELYPDQRTIEDLFPGAWFSPNYDTWIGETEETIAWEYLRQTREFLASVEKDGNASPESLAAATDFMYLAEGSDWFWWYGTDQDSGQDDYFDKGYRALLANVYTSLGEPVPDFIGAPIIQPKPVAASAQMQGLSTPVVDGKVDVDEWSKAAVYSAEGQSPAAGLSYTLDAQNIYVKMDMVESSTSVGLYFVVPGAGSSRAFARGSENANPAPLGLAATHLFELSADDPTLRAYLPAPQGWQPVDTDGQVVAGIDGIFEFSIPYSALGKVTAGDDIRLIAVIQSTQLPVQILPIGGPAQIIIPDIDTSVAVLEVTDPDNDDHGPGTYTYPTDGVFKPQVYDIKSFRVSEDEENVTFKFVFNGPVTNPWGSPNNLAIQTLDVYVDKDPGSATGARLLLPGRNAALSAQNGWEFALWAEGWQPQILVPQTDNLEPVQLTDATLKILVDPSANSVSLRVPKTVLGDGDPAEWGYLAIVMGQEGYPSPGVWRIRDIASSAAQWRFGGAPANTNATRIIDLVWPASQTPTQEEMLSTYPPSTANFETLTSDDFAQLELLVK